jgi:hypothetical protein
MRLRASAGASSFRREPTLKKCLEEARKHIEEVSQESQEGNGPVRQAARKQSAAQDRLKRVERALEELPKVREIKPEATKPQARVSTTDPQARIMKMPNGGFQPAYNAQFATDTATRVIVGVGVTNVGNDYAEMSPMLEQIDARTGVLPRELLVDGGFVKFANIEEMAKLGVTIYAPPQKSKNVTDPYQPKPADTPELAKWRQRMGTPEGKEIYKLRAATAETVNADLKVHRALERLGVRTIPKVRCVIVWAAITYNVLRLIVGS